MPLCKRRASPVAEIMSRKETAGSEGLRAQGVKMNAETYRLFDFSKNICYNIYVR